MSEHRSNATYFYPDELLDQYPGQIVGFDHDSLLLASKTSADQQVQLTPISSDKLLAVEIRKKIKIAQALFGAILLVLIAAWIVLHVTGVIRVLFPYIAFFLILLGAGMLVFSVKRQAFFQSATETWVVNGISVPVLEELNEWIAENKISKT